jgi:electron transfer flavoprotein alpha/beta subunit
MADILVYVLHYEGDFNKNSLGAVSEGARLAGEIGGEAHAVVVGGDDLTDELCQSLGSYGVTKVFRAKGQPEGLAQPVVDAMAKVIEDNGHTYALFGGGLLGFEIGAGLAARLGAGVTMEVTEVGVEDGKLRCERQAEYGYDTVAVELPAVISVGDAINEPRYPSLKAIMGAKKKPLDALSASDAGIDGSKVGADGSMVACGDFHDPPQKEAGQIIEDEDTNETVEKIVSWLEERKLL